MRQLTADDLLTVNVKGANFLFVESNYIFIEHDDFFILIYGSCSSRTEHWVLFDRFRITRIK